MGEPTNDRKSIDELRRRTGMLFQGGALFDSLTVWENVAFALLYRDRRRTREARELAIENLAKVRLPASAADLRRPSFPAACRSASRSRARSSPSPT